MRSISCRAACGMIVAAGVLLGAGGAALAAAAGGYSGKTSQRQAVSFSISRGAVRKFRIVVNDRCPDGHTLVVRATYPTMAISGGKFGGSFSPVRGHPGEHASLHGTVGRRGVTGNLSDTSFSDREQRLCHGSATFTAHHT